MNYIKEINSFYDWLETNSVSDSAINLWHALMSINNKASSKGEWIKEFTVAISTLMVKTSLSKSSIMRARNQLKQLGRIDFKERKGNQSSVYIIFAFHTDTQYETQSVTQCDTQSDTINKLNKTKLEKDTNVSKKKEEESSSHPLETDYEKFNTWIKKNAPYCANIKNFPKQISETSFTSLKQQYTGTQIADVILQLENRKDKRKLYTDLNRTVLNWAKREYGK